VLTADI